MLRKGRLWMRFAVGIVLGATLGCEGKTASTHVHGTVSYRGSVVEEGGIVFADVDTKVKTAATRIEHGAYKVEMLPGEKIVRITASKPTGKILPGPMNTEIPERIEVIPAEFNRDSKLKRVIPPENDVTLDFLLD